MIIISCVIYGDSILENIIFFYKLEHIYDVESSSWMKKVCM
jgi:hypothetical protein